MVHVTEFFCNIMDFCNKLTGNYGWGIVLFTFFSKIVLLPVSIWVQFNSIKLVRIQPDINEIKTAHFGDKDTIADKLSDLYKKEKYNAFASVIPAVIQIALLLLIISAIHEGLARGGADVRFICVDIDRIPIEAGGLYFLIPVIAGLSAYLMCLVQNKANVLQSNSSAFEKYFTMIVSVGISLVLGFYVQTGVIIYWICSNLLSIVQIFALNLFINPAKYIDYERLEKTRSALSELENLEKKTGLSREDRKREKEDYKRFFGINNKHLVFYSESNGFYKYFKGIIEYILDHTNMIIHYITSDPNDSIFEKAKHNDQIKPYFIGDKRLITLMMKIEADVVVMTMPDIENYHIKRSYVDKDIEYIYIPHTLGSMNLVMRNACIDHYDTIFLTGKHQLEETRKTEAEYGLPAKKLIECGYPLLDEMIRDYRQKHPDDTAGTKSEKTVLIAPSWQDNNIMDMCLTDMLDEFEKSSFNVILRPHPQFIRHYPERIELLKERYSKSENILIQTDFSSNDTVFEADLVITDWSGIAYEYAYTTYKPVLFIDTPMKIMNPEYQRIDTVPLNIWMREKIGAALKPDEMDRVVAVSQMLTDRADEYKQIIEGFVNEYVYNLGRSSEISAKYIISTIQEKINSRKR